jgi:hypothetical protein
MVFPPLKLQRRSRTITDAVKDAAMFELRCPKAVAHVMLGSALLLGCAAPPKKPEIMSGAGQTPVKVYTVDTPISVMAADPRCKVILMQDIPGVMTNPKYPLFEDMSLAQIAIFAHGKLPKEKLDEVQADLDKLASQEEGGR